MTSYVSMTSYTLTRPGLVTLWDFIVNIGQQQNIGQGKSYWLSGPYNCHSFSWPSCYLPVCEIPGNSSKIRIYSRSSNGPRSSILVPIESAGMVTVVF